jgi:hypothetical protein
VTSDYLIGRRTPSAYWTRAVTASGYFCMHEEEGAARKNENRTKTWTARQAEEAQESKRLLARLSGNRSGEMPLAYRGPAAKRGDCAGKKRNRTRAELAPALRVSKRPLGALVESYPDARENYLSRRPTISRS